MSQDYFVGIEQPIEVRRNILESSRSVLKGLQAYEDLAEIRSNKIKITLLFRSQLKDVQSSIRKVRSALPKIQASTSSVKSKASVTPKAVKAIESELESIEKELSILNE